MPALPPTETPRTTLFSDGNVFLLSQYQTQVRRLLNDAQKNYWSDPELTDYINEARIRTAIKTLCVRKFQIGTIQANQEQYEYTDVNLALPLGNQVIDIVNITALWNSARIPLGWAPFTQFNGCFRGFVGHTSVPVAFTIYNASEFWIAYLPDQNYVAEFDTAIKPLNLASDNSVDTIPSPYDQAVKYWAARLARLKLQQYAEAKAQEKMFEDEIGHLGAMPPRRIPYAWENEVF